MKNIALSLAAGLALASSAFAGTEVSHKDFKGTPPMAEPCFRDTEFQLDLFGTYTDSRHSSRYSDGFGGGLAVNYFFMRYIGIGVDGNVFDGNANGVWDVTSHLIARYPIEGGSFCFAPYAFAGGGVETDGTTSGTYHAGGGLEWRATHQFGIFAEGRYTWAAQNNDAAQARLGVRFAF
ncbi:MAG: hypothetical protein JWL59_2768 [Chthoniobacteraceae bacterium]|nr:hypothetical protein [Chthoniobacteraceae bacterium]